MYLFIKVGMMMKERMCSQMTDRFAIARHEELVGPVNLPADRF